MIGQVQRYLRAAWPGFGLGSRPAAGGLRLAVISGGMSIHNKLVCPCWQGGAPLPCLIVKFPRYPQYNHRMQAEYEVLLALQPHLPPGAPRAPRPLASTVLDGVRVTMETALPGRALLAHLREHPGGERAILESLAPFAGWLGALQARSAQPARPAQMQEQVHDLLAAAAAELTLEPAEQTGLAHLQDLAATLAATAPLPIVFSHNDLSTVNVLVDRDGAFAGVIDWESGGPGLPATDLLYFLWRYGYETRAAGTGDQLRGFRELFFPGEPLAAGTLPAALAGRWLAGYCRTVGLAPAWLPVLFACGLIHHARNERYLIGLHASGRMLYIMSTTVAGPAAGTSTQQRGHFRAQLGFYLEHRTAFQGGRSAVPAA